MIQIQIFTKVPGHPPVMLMYDTHEVCEAQKIFDFVGFKQLTDDYGHTVCISSADISHIFVIDLAKDRVLAMTLANHKMEIDMEQALMKADAEVDFRRKHNLRTGAMGQVS